MTTRAEIVAEARSWIGTPFHHAGRKKGVGVDCLGLVTEVGQALGLLPGFRQKPYGPQPNIPWLLRELPKWLDPTEALRPGNVVLVSMRVQPMHLAILAEHKGRLTAVHAVSLLGVREHSLDGAALRPGQQGEGPRIHRIYTYRGVED